MLQNLPPRHTLRKNLPLYNFMRGLSAVHPEPRKRLSAFWAFHIPPGMVFGNPLHHALHQSASPAFAVFVQQ